MNSETTFPFLIGCLLYVTFVSAQPQPPFPPASIHYAPNFHQEFEEPLSVRNDSTFTVLGRWAWGECYGADAQGSYAFIGNGCTLQALDMTNVSQPVIVSEYIATSPIYDVTIRDSLAFVGTRSELLIVSISDPTHLRKVGSVAISDLVNQVVLENQFAYVLTWSGIMIVVDISNVAQPFVRRAIAGGGEFSRCIAVKSGYVYLGDTQAPRLVIVNATNPDSLSYTTLSVAGRVAFAEVVDTLLLAGHAAPRTFQVYSIATPSTPRLISELPIPGRSNTTYGMRTLGKKTYLCYSDTGIVEVDIENPQAPVVRRILNKPALGLVQGRGAGIAPLGNRLVVGYYTGMLIVNLADPDSMTFGGFFPSGGLSFDVAVKNNIAYVASSLSGLWLVDVSDPFKPKSISNIQTGGSAARVAVSDTVCFVMNPGTTLNTASVWGLWSIGISDMNRPYILSKYTGIVRPTSIFNSIKEQGGRVFMTQRGNDSTMEIVDVRSPGTPIGLGILRGKYSPTDIFVRDSIVYMTTADSGGITVDVREYNAPVRIGSFLNSARGVDVTGTLLITRSDSITLMSVVNPILPYRLGVVASPVLSDFGSRFILSGAMAYTTNRNLFALDISTPSRPIIKGEFAVANLATAAAINEGNVLLLDQQQSMWILRNNFVTSVNNRDEQIFLLTLKQNYPNPFNPTTTINFSIPIEANISLTIFDLLGRKVSELASGRYTVGNHSLTWNANNISSGVYFARLNASELNGQSTFSKVSKLVLMK